MNYFSYQKADVLNGEGMRCVLWVSGCSHGCSGCFSPESHSVNHGLVFDQEIKERILLDLSKSYITGFTWSGGDPMHKRNFTHVKTFSSQIKKELPSKDIWLYTGFTFEEILKDKERREVLEYVDVLVDGKFDESLKSRDAKFRGSTNQRLVDVQCSLQKGEVVLL